MKQFWTNVFAQQSLIHPWPSWKHVLLSVQNHHPSTTSLSTVPRFRRLAFALMCWSSALSPHPGSSPAIPGNGACWRSSTFADALTHLSNVCRFIVFNVPERIEFPFFSASWLKRFSPPLDFSWVFFNFLILVRVPASASGKKLIKLIATTSVDGLFVEMSIAASSSKQLITLEREHQNTLTRLMALNWPTNGYGCSSSTTPPQLIELELRPPAMTFELAWLWGVSIFPNDNNLSLVRADTNSAFTRCGSFLKLT